MFSWRFKVSDDRGKRVPAFNWRRVDRFRRDTDPGMLCARRADPGFGEAELSTRMWPLGVLLVAVFVAMIFALYSVWFVVPLVVIGCGAREYWRESAWRSLRSSMIRDGYCASCSYTLADSPIKPDGCRVCPECGAAWRLDSSALPDARS